MHSFNVDSSILDRKKIEIAIITVCHNKKKKHGKEFFTKSIKSLIKIKKIKEIIRNESRKYDFAQQAV